MKTKATTRQEFDQRLERVGRALSLGVALVACLNLGGWLLDIGLLKTLFIGRDPMAPMSTAAFLACGFGSWLSFDLGSRERVGRALGGTAAMLALVALIEAMSGGDSSSPGPSGNGGGASIPTLAAVYILACGVAVAVGRHRRVRGIRLMDVLALVALVGGLVPSVAYILSPWLGRIPAGMDVGLPTAVLLTAASTSAMMLAGRHGLAGLLSSEFAGGWVLRRVLPLVLLVSTVPVWLGAWAASADGLHTEQLQSILMTTTAGLAALLVALVAAPLNRAEAQQAQLVGALDASFAEIFTFDPGNFRFVFANKGALTAFGRNMDELKALSVVQELDGVDSVELRTRVSQLVRGEIQSASVEFDRIRADGRVYPAELRLRFQEGGETGLVVAALRDLTGQRAAESARVEQEAFREVSRTKDEFMATISHEMRTPMNAIVGMAGLMADTTLTKEQQDYLHTLRVNGEHLLTLIDDVLDYAKLEAGRLSLQSRSFELAECVDDAVDLVAASASKAGLNLSHRIAPSTPAIIKGDVTRLRQILGNLLFNAVKFTPKGSVQLEVSSRHIKDDEHVLKFVVSDTGIGIPSETIPRLFKPFVQADTSATRRYGGAGMGLAICKRLADVMGGKLSVESTEGVGSQFTLEVTCPGFTDRRSKPRKEFVDLSDKRILCITDTEAARKSLEAHLEEWRAEASFVDSAEAVLQEVNRGDPFDLFIMDFDQSGEAASELARELRERGGRSRLPTLLLTATEFDQTLVARDLIDAVVVKPARKRTLGRRINELLRPRAGHRVAESGGVQPANAQILLVDDLDDNVKLGVLLLRKLGYSSVDVAVNGKEAVDAVEKKKYDVVLMDVMMPVMDGLQATQEIRERFPREQCPAIIAVTAKGDRARCIEVGMDDYISKPIRIAQLRDALQRNLGSTAEPAAAERKGPTLTT